MVFTELILAMSVCDMIMIIIPITYAIYRALDTLDYSYMMTMSDFIANSRFSVFLRFMIEALFYIFIRK